MMEMSDEYRFILDDYKAYLRIERSLSPNTISSYCSDIEQLFLFLKEKGFLSPSNASSDDLVEFISAIAEKGIAKRSQARIISSLKSFYSFLEVEGQVKDNPCDKLDAPKMQLHLPSVLSIEEVMAERIAHLNDK